MKIVKFGIGVVLMIGIGYVGMRFKAYIDTPAFVRSKEADLRRVLQGRAVREVTPEPDGSIMYRGKFMSFKYPAKAVVYPTKKDDESILERVDLEIKQPRLSVVAVAINSQEKVLSDVPGVSFRQNQKDIYKESLVTVGPDKTSVFTKLDGKEKTVFVLYQDRLFTLSVTGNNAMELDSLWNEILPTFHFK